MTAITKNPVDLALAALAAGAVFAGTVMWLAQRAVRIRHQRENR